MVKLKPYNLHEVRERMLLCEERIEDTFEEGLEEVLEGEGNGDLIHVGDNFVVLAMEGNPEGVEFYILQCSRAKHQVSAPFTCPWGPDYEVGDLVVRGTYYQKWNNGYVYLSNSRPAHNDAHLIVHCKFAMIPEVGRRKGGEVTYSLSQDSLATIRAGLDRLREDED